MPSKFNRKLIAVGETSTGVVLPRAWLRYYGLKNGDQVELIANGEITVKKIG